MLTIDQAISNIQSLTDEQLQMMITQCDNITQQYQEILEQFPKYGCGSCNRRRLARAQARRQRFVEELTARKRDD